MRKHLTTAVAVTLVVTLVLAGGLAAQQGNRPGKRDKKDQDEKSGEAPAEPVVELPQDPRLLALHRDFVAKAEKLAVEYERGNQVDKAAEVYAQILKLIPNYPPAVKKLAEVRERQATAERKVLDVAADQGWQPAGVYVTEGKPVRIKANGEWTFRMVHKISADGMEIPEELRDFRLGSLVGMIAGGDPKEVKPFMIGSQYEFTPERSGQLMLRMYDSDPSDNAGKLEVEITGTFEKRG